MGLYARWAGRDPNVVKIAILYMHANYREVLTARMNVNGIKDLHQMTVDESLELDNMIDYFQSLDDVNKDLYTDRWLRDCMLECEQLIPVGSPPPPSNPTGVPGDPVIDEATCTAAIGLDFGQAGGAVAMAPKYITPSQVAKWQQLIIQWGTVHPLRKSQIQALLP